MCCHPVYKTGGGMGAEASELTMIEPTGLDVLCCKYSSFQQCDASAA